MQNKIKLALKIDIDTYQGTKYGTPKLLSILDEFNIKATFFATLGPDKSGKAITRVFTKGFLKRMARLGATTKGGKGMSPRIKPLYLTPEKEVIAYASLNKINHFSEQCCPFSWQAKRNAFRTMLNEMETKFPGTQPFILAEKDRKRRCQSKRRGSV